MLYMATLRSPCLPYRSVYVSLPSVPQALVQTRAHGLAVCGMIEGESRPHIAVGPQLHMTPFPSGLSSRIMSPVSLLPSITISHVQIVRISSAPLYVAPP